MSRSSSPASGSSREPTRFAAIDIGSDTVHLLIAELSGSPATGSLRVLHSESDLVELGRVVGRRGRITNAAEAEVRRHLDRMVRRAHKAGATLLIAATEASRQAANGQEVLARLAAHVGAPIRLLSPAREAQLGFVGVRPELPNRGDLIVIDSGGASTEVTLAHGRTIAQSGSLPVGASLLAAGLKGDPPAPIDWALTSIRIGATLGALPPGRPRRAIATGGTAHGLLELSRFRSRHRHGSGVELTLGELEKVAAGLLARPAARIGADAGIDSRRVALLAPGVLILSAIVRHYGLTEFRVVEAGLREGMIRVAAANAHGWWLDSPSKA